MNVALAADSELLSAITYSTCSAASMRLKANTPAAPDADRVICAPVCSAGCAPRNSATSLIAV